MSTGAAISSKHFANFFVYLLVPLALFAVSASTSKSQQFTIKPQQFTIKAKEPPDAPVARPGKLFFNHPFLLRSAAVYGASFADMHEWLATRRKLVEQDPFAKPFVRLPAPAYYAGGFALATGVNLLSYKMGRSHLWRRYSFLPQLISIGGNTFGFAHTRYAAANCSTCVTPANLRR